LEVFVSFQRKSVVKAVKCFCGWFWYFGGIIDYISKNTYYIHIQKILRFTPESGR